jgi:hypothetical protein
VLRTADIEDVHARAGIAERVSDRTTDAAAPTSDDGYVLLKIITRLAGKFRYREHR